MHDPVQEIKNKLQIEDVVGTYVQLKRSGKLFKACCPFHNEKTPSFIVSPERQMAYCFGCHKGGDLFQFIQDIEGLDFRGALELLAEKANVELPSFNPEKAKVSKDLKDRLKTINEDVNNFFVQQLWETENGIKVLDYIKNRAITEETIKSFALGFIDEVKDTLYRFLLEKKHSKEDILASSVALARDSTNQDIVDRFRLRLMVPIHNEKGEIIAFGGRALKKGEEPKYLNSPEYVLYDKSSTLFNLHRAKETIRKEDFAVFVEGYFDVMASWQAGVKNVVATCGTALTENQLKIVKRYTKNIVFAFDSDKAGEEALLRGVKIAQRMDLNLFVISIDEKDCAELIKKDPNLWLKAVEEKKPYLEHFENFYLSKFNLEDPEQKKEYTDAIIDLLEGVSHPVLKDHYLKNLAKKVGTPVELLYDFLAQRIVMRKKERKKEEKIQDIKKSRELRLRDYFLGMVLAFPKQFFELKMNSEEKFKEASAKLGMINQLGEASLNRVPEFREKLPEFLSDASSVYNEIENHYNLHARLDEAFYSLFENKNELQKLALEAEIKNPDENLIEEEFQKLILLLYLEFINTPHG